MKVPQYRHTWDGNTSVASDEFRFLASEVLRQWGYDVLGGDDMVFGRDESAKARFQVGGTVDELAYDTYGSLAGNRQEAVLGVQWELLDTRTDSNPKQDVALLKMEGSNHDCIPLADEPAAVGSDVFGIGSPRSERLSFSVTRGVVSGYRDLDAGSFIQTDASLNPGNSGGPLISADGYVLGIVSWKLPEDEGLAFGVPVDVIEKALNLKFIN